VYTVVRVVVKVMVSDEEDELEAAAEDEDEVGVADEDDGEVMV